MTTNNRRRHQIRLRGGTTLIEVMMAIVILLVIALGTSTAFQLSQSLANGQRDRRLAMEKTNGRLEELRAATYTDISPPFNNYAIYYVDRITGNWRISTANPGEIIILAGQPHPMSTTVQYMDIDGSSNSFDCLRINVQTQYGRKASDVIALATLESLL